jgi:nicotinamidase-related amidase
MAIQLDPANGRIFMSQTNRLANRSEKGLLTHDNCVVVIIDIQPQMIFGVASHDRQGIINNNLVLAKAAKIFGVPLVLSTVESKGFSGNILPQLQAIYPEQTPIERSTMNSWDDKNFVAAVEATGRKKILVAGLWTETCVALPTIQMIHDGYEVYVVEDCCGDVSALAHDNSMKRRRKTGDGALRTAGMAAGLGIEGHVQRRNGSGEDALRRLRCRRRVRLHDGAWRATDQGAGIRCAIGQLTEGRRPCRTPRR